MDERVMKKCVGKPVPDWDLVHRLPINRSVGPDVQDFGSTFSLNSTFMDVIEPSFLEKQWFITGVVLAFVIVRLLMMPLILVFTVMRIMANATCRDPVWPEAVEKISRVDADDPYADPAPARRLAGATRFSLSNEANTRTIRKPA